MNEKHQMNVVLVAEEAAGIQALRLLMNSNHTLSGVLTTFDSSNELAGPKNKLSVSSIAGTANGFGIPVQDAGLVTDPGFASWMESNQIDVLLNIHSLYRVCPEVIQAARVGAFNLHPGPLPGYAGLNVPSWAVYNEEPSHAVTLHHISDKIDAGHIVYETRFPLTSKDTGLSVSIACAKKGLELIRRLLIELSRDPLSVPHRPQSPGKRTIYKRNEIPGGGLIQWTEPAHKVDAFVRACNYKPFPSPWGEPKTRWGEKEITISKTILSNKICDEEPGTIGEITGGKTAIATADHWILIDKCNVDGESVVASSLLKEGDRLYSGF